LTLIISITHINTQSLHHHFIKKEERKKLHYSPFADLLR
jgi:hypothetical protein